MTNKLQDVAKQQKRNIQKATATTSEDQMITVFQRIISMNLCGFRRKFSQVSW